MTVAAFDKRTLRERCTSHVRSQIINGDIRPGEHLVETKLANEFGVSRGTLREALRPLQNEGLLVDDGRGHLLVRTITAAEIGEVFLVRAAIESLAASLLADRGDRVASAEQLRASLVPLQDEKLPFADQIATDLGFHELICRLTGNSTLLTSWLNLRGQIEMMIVAAGPSLAAGRMRYAEHVTIAEAIGQGDTAVAREVVENHMADFSRRYTSDRERTATN